MVLQKQIVKKSIIATDEVYDINKIYKGVKEKGEKLGYMFFENEQKTKPSKYGQKLNFEFLFVKENDYFGMNEILAEFNFENLKNSGGKLKGNCEVKISGTITLDYKNRWGMSAFSRFLLGLYMKVKEKEMKAKYIIPLIIDSNKLQDFIKENFGFYLPS